MKKIVRVVSVIAAVLLMTSSVNAEGLFIEIIGRTDSDALGATVLVLNKDTNIASIKSEDIKYVDQSDINPDGTYVIKLPVNLDYDNLSTYSNMGDVELPGAAEYASIIYVSADGSDTNSGLMEETPVKTLTKAYAKAKMPAKIVLLTNLTYTNPNTKNYNGLLTIEGINPNIELALPETVNLYGDLTLDNLKMTKADTVAADKNSSIRARGHALTVGINVTSDQRPTVYGGGVNENVNGDTHVTLLGGRYTSIYGGCYNAKVTGSTHVIIGGNVNKGDGIIDFQSDISPCSASGGGLGETSTGGPATVEGDINITIKDNAVTKYIFGAGRNYVEPKGNVNVFIEGGKVMNVFGGSNNAAINANTHITMTGGLVEAIFGGTQGNSMTGSTCVTLLGGEVARRVFGGCYNNTGSGTTHHVTGNTCLIIGPEMNGKLATGTGLGGMLDNDSDKYISACSRKGATLGGILEDNDEIKSLIFLDDAYSISALNSKVTGTKNYTINSGSGGRVEPTATAGTFKVIPDDGKHAVSGGKTVDGDTITVAKNSVTAVTFEDNDFYIKSLGTVEEQDGITATVELSAKNIDNEPYVLVAVYDSEDENHLIAVGTRATSPNRTTESIKLDVDFEAGKTYIVKAMIWDKDVQPLTSRYLINLTK